MGNVKFLTLVESLEMVANSIQGGQLGIKIVTDTEPAWKSKVASKNPYLGRVRKVSTYTDAGFGCEYRNTVESHAKRSGVDTKKTPFVVQPRKGMHRKYADNPKIWVSDTNPNQQYIAVVFRGNEKDTIDWYLDGVRICDSSVIADIKSHIRPKSTPKNQLNYGVAEEDIVPTISVKFENVVELSHGSRAKYLRGQQVVVIDATETALATR